MITWEHSFHWPTPCTIPCTMIDEFAYWALWFLLVYFCHPSVKTTSVLLRMQHVGTGSNFVACSKSWMCTTPCSTLQSHLLSFPDCLLCSNGSCTVKFLLCHHITNSWHRVAGALRYFMNEETCYKITHNNIPLEVAKLCSLSQDICECLVQPPSNNF